MSWTQRIPTGPDLNKTHKTTHSRKTQFTGKQKVERKRERERKRLGEKKVNLIDDNDYNIAFSKKEGYCIQTLYNEVRRHAEHSVRNPNELCSGTLRWYRVSSYDRSTSPVVFDDENSPRAGILVSLGVLRNTKCSFLPSPHSFPPCIRSSASAENRRPMASETICCKSRVCKTSFCGWPLV